MKKSYQFSIIIGAYNQARYMETLAKSLHDQTVQDFEIHLCDDGSSDGTREAFEKALHPLIRNTRYHYHRQEQKGRRLARNWNQGITAAAGEYCVLMAGDSFLDERYLEVLQQFARPHRILCGVRYQVHNGIGVDMDWRITKGLIPLENVMLPAQPFNNITGNGLTIPTAAFRAHGLIDEEITGYGGEDNEIVGRLYYKGYVVFSLIDARLYHHWHPSSEMPNVKQVSAKVQSYAN